MPNPVIGLLNRFKIWRMQRRGDALVDVKPFFDTMIDLADEIVQEPQSEIPRDLFIMLAYVFTAKEGRSEANGHFEILPRIHRMTDVFLVRTRRLMHNNQKIALH